MVLDAPALIAEACLTYGWTPCQVLAMPASRFFSVFKAGQKIKFAEKQMTMAALCDIAAIPMANVKYYESVRHGFITSARSLLPAVDVPKIKNNAVDSGSEAAKDAMFAAVQAMKGGARGR